MDAPSIRVESSGEVAVVRLERGKANALDTTLCRDLVACLGDVTAGGHRAVVLTGQGPIFSAGVDLHRLTDGGTDYVDEFLPGARRRVCRRIRLPHPSGRCRQRACDRRRLHSGLGL